MANLNDPAENVGELLRAVRPRPLDSTLSASVRQRLLTPAPAARPRATRGLLLAAAVLGALLVVLGVVALRPSPVSFTVGGSALTAERGDWLGSDEVETRIRFSDGTRLSVAAAGRVRVTETTPNGASVMIERGSLEADVVHTASSQWRFLAGPFEITVTGTSFTASWDPSADRLDLSMSSGSVLVTGPVLGTARAVRGGERLSVSLREQRMTLETLGAGADASAVAAQSTPSGAAPVPALVPQPEASPPVVAPPVVSAGALVEASSHRAPAPRWLSLARQGRHKDAMAALDDAAFSAALGASAHTLLELADSARLGGQPGRAREALLAARTKHHVTGSSAFLLGKIAADQLKSPTDALRWFETYLVEQPGGALAEQALARILELHSAGSGEAARSAATRYLAAHPNGSRAALARSVLER